MIQWVNMAIRGSESSRMASGGKGQWSQFEESMLSHHVLRNGPGFSEVDDVRTRRPWVFSPNCSYILTLLWKVHLFFSFLLLISPCPEMTVQPTWWVLFTAVTQIDLLKWAAFEPSCHHLMSKRHYISKWLAIPSHQCLYSNHWIATYWT